MHKNGELFCFPLKRHHEQNSAATLGIFSATISRLLIDFPLCCLASATAAVDKMEEHYGGCCDVKSSAGAKEKIDGTCSFSAH